jgi:hypothetical protein
MTEEMKLQIIGLKLEGIVKTWWDTQLENYSWIMDRGDLGRDTNTTHYNMGWILPGSPRTLLPTVLSPKPPRPMVAVAKTIQSVCPKLHRCLLQIAHLAAHQRSRRGISYKIQLDGLLMHLHHEVDLFESSSLDKAFLRTLVVERKVAP